MAKTLSEAPITTANARSKLGHGEFARRLDPDAAIWYRKGKRGGVWFVRWRNHGRGANYRQAAIGPANDLNDKPTERLFTFHQAEQAAGSILSAARAELRALADGEPLTVRVAVEDYIKGRDARDSRRKGRSVRSDASLRLHRYVVGMEKVGQRKAVDAAPLSSILLHMLKEEDLLAWRADLPDSMKATTKQRLTNDLKAALNGAYTANRGRLEPNLPAIIKHGLKADIVDEDESIPLARENQILGDSCVAALLNAAREIDQEQSWEGDLFRLVVVLAATGARFSQIIRMNVGDCQRDQQRLLIPASRKGRGGKRGPISVPIGSDVLEALLPVATDRSANEPLLERWRSRQVKGSIHWERDKRGRWEASSELVRPWKDIRIRAGLPDVIPYALRHSSIVRGIKANLPIRLVAALHDTSVGMIERHYSRWIVDGLDEMAARAVVPLLD